MKLVAKTTAIKTELVKNGLYIKVFAEYLSITRHYLSNIINGNKSPGPKLAKQIADYFGKDIEDLFTIEQ